MVSIYMYFAYVGKRTAKPRSANITHLILDRKKNDFSPWVDVWKTTNLTQNVSIFPYLNPNNIWNRKITFYYYNTLPFLHNLFFVLSARKSFLCLFYFSYQQWQFKILLRYIILIFKKLSTPLSHRIYSMIFQYSRSLFQSLSSNIFFSKPFLYFPSLYWWTLALQVCLYSSLSQ